MDKQLYHTVIITVRGPAEMEPEDIVKDGTTLEEYCDEIDDKVDALCRGLCIPHRHVKVEREGW